MEAHTCFHRVSGVMFGLSLKNDGVEGHLVGRYFLSVFERCRTSCQYPADYHVMTQGFPSRDVFFVESGFLKITRAVEAGQEFIMCFVKDHWILGMDEAFIGVPYMYSATTLTPSRIISMATPDFLKWVQTDVDFSRHLHRLQALKFYVGSYRFADMTYMPAERRLSAFIGWMLKVLEPADGGWSGIDGVSFRLPLRQHQIAQVLAITPEHLCRIIRDLEDRGLILRHKDMICVPDPAAFPRLASLKD